MRREQSRTATLVTAAAAIGWIGWSGHVLLLPAVVLFPALWSRATTRWQAAFVSAGYFLAASRGLPLGVANYYASNIWPGLALWLIASSVFVGVHAACWSDRRHWQVPLRYLCACFAMAVPPAGIVGWAHPMTAAGVLFPGGGFWGLSAMAICLALMTTRYRTITFFAVAGLWALSAAVSTAPHTSVTWRGVDLQEGAALGRTFDLERQRALVSRVRQFPAHTTVLLPESALGLWTPTLRHFWEDALLDTDIAVVAGAAIIDGVGYDNVLLRLSAQGSDVMYRQRMPVPGSMWQPGFPLLGMPAGAHAHFFTNPVVRSARETVAPLICYEQLLIWPILHSMLYGPDMIATVGNDWWTQGTSIPAIQRAAAMAWARLFDIPLVTSFNT